MKKIIIFIVLSFASVTMLCAQISLGARASMNIAAGTKFPANTEKSLNNYEDSGADVSRNFYNGGGFVLSCRYAFPFSNNILNNFGVQTEFGFAAKNGIAYKIKDGENVLELSHQYNSFEIPFLFSYEHDLKNFFLGVVGGVNLCFTKDVDFFSDATEGNVIEKKSSTPLVFGLTTGLVIGYKIKHHIIALDLRYIADTMTFEVENVAILLRRSVTVSAGYKYCF